MKLPDSIRCYCGRPLALENFETKDEPLFDTFTLAPPYADAFYCFAVPVGQQGKGFEDTNMLMCGMLPFPQFFLVRTFQVTISGPFAQFFANMYRVELHIGGRVVFAREVDKLTNWGFAGSPDIKAPELVEDTILQGENFLARFVKTNPGRMPGSALIRVQINGTRYLPKERG